MLVFIQKSKSGSLSLSVYKAAPFVWQQMILLMYINKSLPSRASLAHSLQPIFFPLYLWDYCCQAHLPEVTVLQQAGFFRPQQKKELVWLVLTERK